MSDKRKYLSRRRIETMKRTRTWLRKGLKGYTEVAKNKNIQSKQYGSWLLEQTPCPLQ